MTDQSGFDSIDVDKKYLTHRESNRYSCKWTEFRRPGVSGVVKWFCEGSGTTIPKQEELDRALPVINPSFDKFGSEDTKHGICVTWLGHACVLVQIDGVKILADPVFSSKCGPKFGVQLGYTRYREAPCSVESLPDIDAVIISHNHYDHLDYNTVCQLADRFHDLKWFVPVGVKAFMESCQCKNVEECEWWKGHSHKNVRFTFVPAQHWSKRGLMDDNVSLWGGWCIRGSQQNFYFSGDTGYDGELFKTIGEKLGPFDLAAIPIGAYCPRWFMQHHHIDPEEALKVHEDVKATRSIGIHWGTFNLSSEPYLEPRDKVKELQIKKIIEILLIKVITESLQTEKYEELQRGKILEWVRKKIEELQNEKKEKQQTEEKIKEWLCKKVGELQIEKIEKFREIEEIFRANIKDLLHEKIELQKKIDEWLKKEIEELQKKNEIELWDGGNFFTINIGETKFIRSQH